MLDACVKYPAYLSPTRDSKLIINLAFQNKRNVQFDCNLQILTGLHNVRF